MSDNEIPYLAIGNNEPIPENLPEELKTVIRQGRVEAGFDDDGNRIETDSRPQSSQADASELDDIDRLIYDLGLYSLSDINHEYYGYVEVRKHIAAQKQRWETAARQQVLNSLPENTAWASNDYHAGYKAAIEAVRSALATVPKEKTND